MAVDGEEKIRGLIRLIKPARALRMELEKNLHMEMYSGAGDMAVRSYRGLRESVAALTDDPYLQALTLDVRPELTDREKVSVVLLMAGQLAAYLEGATGVAGLEGGGDSINIQTAPIFQGSSIRGHHVGGSRTDTRWEAVRRRGGVNQSVSRVAARAAGSRIPSPGRAEHFSPFEHPLPYERATTSVSDERGEPCSEPDSRALS